MTPSNIKSGFKATGLYPFDPTIIPEEAYKPSTASELPGPEIAATSTPRSSPQPGPSSSSPRARFLSGDRIEDAIIDESSSSDDEESANTSTFKELLPTPVKKAPKASNRQPAMNSRAVVLERNLFSKKVETNSSACKTPKVVLRKNEVVIKPPATQTCMKTSSKTVPKNESWYCKLCKQYEIKDMRLCVLCRDYT